MAEHAGNEALDQLDREFLVILHFMRLQLLLIENPLHPGFGGTRQVGMTGASSTSPGLGQRLNVTSALFSIYLN
jgi:hypothetical protein